MFEIRENKIYVLLGSPNEPGLRLAVMSSNIHSKIYECCFFLQPGGYFSFNVTGTYRFFLSEG